MDGLVPGAPELRVPDPAERENLTTFLTRALRVDPAAVVRLRQRGPQHVTLWVATGFEVLAARTIGAELSVPDVTVAADTVLSAVPGGTAGTVPLGYSMDSAWRTGLPPVAGFTHVDDVPARALVELAGRGAELADQHGSSHGPPTGLLEQTVLTVTGNGDSVEVPMRVVFALTAMDFIPHASERAIPRRIDPEEVVRVRTTRTWLRLDARYGSVARRRGPGMSLLTG